MGSHWEGTIALGELQDLPPELQSQAQVPIQVDLNCLVDEGGFCVVKGEITVDLTLVCQRCMKPLEYKLNTQFVVSPVENDEDAKQLPEQYEPLMVSDGEINLATWIAEELYLALPFAPRHDYPCESLLTNNGKDEEIPVKPESPFAILKK